MQAHWLEIVFLISSVVVGGYAFRELLEARRDKRFVLDNGLNGDRKVVAEFFEFNGWVRVIKVLVMFIGSVVCLILPPPWDVSPMPWQSMILLVLWLVMGTCLIALSMQAKRVRVRLRRHDRAALEP